ncbi:MAG: tetratricopeptide repeat protein [Bacteroidota bacterium]
MILKFVYAFLCCLCFVSMQAQTIIDIKHPKNDTTTVNALNKLGREYLLVTDYFKADSCFDEALKIAAPLQYKRGLFNIYNQKGVIYWYRDEFSKALQNYLKALKIAEELNDRFLISRSQANVGLVFISQKEFSKALIYYTKALKLKEDLHETRGVSAILNNIGTIYQARKDYQQALMHFSRSLEIARADTNHGMEALDLSSIAEIYELQQNQEKALATYIEALDISEHYKDKILVPIMQHKIAAIYIQQKKYDAAQTFLESGLNVSLETGDLGTQKDINRSLSELFAINNNWKRSYLHYKTYTALKDSIYNENKTKDMVRNEMNFDFDKKQALDKKEQEKKDAVTAEEIKQQRMQRNYFIIGFILMLIVAGLVYRSYRQKQKANNIIALQKQEVEKQKEIVENQKQSLEEHQKEIIDSITYAKRLQEAILPPQEFINTYLPHNFIYYKPKDLVAGDFYWAEAINGLFFIAAADSTGHGVPGCMVSVVCSNALNRSVKEFNITDTGKILEKTRELVVETFEKSTNEVKDGMDISLLCIDTKNKKIIWSGANNPLWYIESAGDVSPAITEIKADKQPIGKTDSPKPFTNHEIEYKVATTFYLFTDGYADQFGGEKGKKFKYKQFSNLLLQNYRLSMQEQKDLLDKAFQNWRGDLEQVDDVCVIGIKL